MSAITMALSVALISMRKRSAQDWHLTSSSCVKSSKMHYSFQRREARLILTSVS